MANVKALIEREQGVKREYHDCLGKHKNAFDNIDAKYAEVKKMRLSGLEDMLKGIESETESQQKAIASDLSMQADFYTTLETMVRMIILYICLGIERN